MKKRKEIKLPSGLHIRRQVVVFVLVVSRNVCVCARACMRGESSLTISIVRSSVSGQANTRVSMSVCVCGNI